MSDALSGCAAVRELAPELALGLITGDERATALDHLDRCPSCRALVDELAATSDALLLLAPEAEPPAGFETRVVARMGPVSSSRRSWWRRRELVAWVVAAACLIVLALVVVADRDGGGGGGVADLRVATMATRDGREVGEVYIRDGGDELSWVHLSLPGWAGWESGEWSIRVTLADGSEATVDVPSLSGRQTWGIDLPVDGGDVTEVAMVTGDGHVWCTGEL